jgi:protein ImuB
MFAGIFVENFLVQAVIRGEPALRNCALALVEGNPPLVNVVAVNEAAQHLSITIGMPKATAAQFVGVEIRERSTTQEKSAHAALLDLGWSVSPRLEDTAPDTLVADIAGLSGIFGSEERIAKVLIERGNACGLRLNVSVAASPDTAVIAARGFSGIHVIAKSEEATQLSQLPVNVLRLSPETAETLERWGVRTCGSLAALPLLELSERLGQEGVRLHALASGKGSRALAIAEPAYAFEEELELDDGVEELEPLSFLLGRLLDQLCARLAARALAASVIRMRFDLEPSFEAAIDTKNEIVRRKYASRVYERELQLPVPIRDTKTLLKLVRLRLQMHPPQAPIVKLWMAAEAARPRFTQNGLFLPSFPDAEKLELTVARIAGIVGENNVGSPELLDTHRPDAFVMRPFRPAHDEHELKKRNQKAIQHLASRKKAALSCRLFRPPLAAKVEVQNGMPLRVFFQGKRGNVVAAAGPWKSSGEWWRDDEWRHEEWDLEIAFRPPRKRDFFSDRENISPRNPEIALYRVFYDAKSDAWFVRGFYD